MLALLDDQRTVTPAGVPVSPMQRELLRHLAEGLTGEQSARRFGIPPYGVWNRLRALYDALEVGTASRAVARAHELGLLAREPWTLPPLPAGKRDLLRRIARGESDAQIAKRLGLHVSTVRHRLSDLYREIGVRNRPSAIHAAFCTGLLDGAEAVPDVR